MLLEEWHPIRGHQRVKQMEEEHQPRNGRATSELEAEKEGGAACSLPTERRVGLESRLQP